MEWMYTVLKNQTFELMLSFYNKNYSFSAAIQSCFSKSTMTLIPARLSMTDDRFDNFSLMTDKIQLRSTDKGFVVLSNDEAMLVW